MANIKMIVTDLDATLLRDDKSVSACTIKTLRACREKGIKVVYATARGSLPDNIPLEIFSGSARNGGAVAVADGKKVYEKLISTVQIRDFLIACDKAEIKTALVKTTGNNSKHYANFKVDDLVSYVTDFEIVSFAELDTMAEKGYAAPESQRHIDIIKNNLPDCLKLIVARDDAALFMHPEATKSKAIAALAEHWGIRREEIAAFGDDINDIDMLQFCGISVAVGNAIDEVKAVADYICDTNENDGVARWIEENALV